MMKLFKKLLAVAMVARMLFTPMMRQKVLFMH